MSEAGHELTSSGYIKHHLVNLQACSTEQGIQWGPEACAGNFYTVHVDSIGFAVVLGLIFVTLFRSVAKKATTGVPGKLQAFVEIIIEFVDKSVKETSIYCHGLLVLQA